jgi:hypothetical protein
MSRNYHAHKWPDQLLSDAVSKEVLRVIVSLLDA